MNSIPNFGSNRLKKKQNFHFGTSTRNSAQKKEEKKNMKNEKMDESSGKTSETSHDLEPSI
jgi:hypothetical protein